MKYIAPPYLATRVHCIYNISSYSIYACIKQGIAHYTSKSHCDLVVDQEFMYICLAAKAWADGCQGGRLPCQKARDR